MSADSVARTDAGRGPVIAAAPRVRGAPGGFRHWRALCAGLLVVALAACGDSAAPDAGGREPPPTESPLTVRSRQMLGERLEEWVLRSPALAEETRVRVLLPRGYDASGATRYPVLYLYHGSLDDEKAWTDKGDVERLTADYPLIVVMPYAGSGGYYTDWYNFGAGGPPMWETYHVGQLIPWIDATYPTRDAREGRATTGLSMGGFGAFAYAAKHPDLFVAAASFSGALNINQPADTGQPDQSVFDGGLPFATWGLRTTDEVRWRGQNPWDLAENLRGLNLMMRTGTGLPGPGYNSFDPIEALLYLGNVDLHEKLEALGIAHRWEDYGPGGHEWQHWQRGLERALPLLMQSFAQPPPPPDPFSYVSIQPAYAVYGWQLRWQRPALEFSRLAVDGRRVELSGSGEAQLVTPPRYVPGRVYAVTREIEGATETLSLTADRDGRLSIELPLGPANPFQQFTPQARLAGTRVYRARVDLPD